MQEVEGEMCNRTKGLNGVGYGRAEQRKAYEGGSSKLVTFEKIQKETHYYKIYLIYVHIQISLKVFWDNFNHVAK